MVASNNAIDNTVGASISGVTNTLTVTNPSNTASSAARETIIVGGGTAGDPTINWNVSGVTNWEMGIDNSVSDNLTISQGTVLGTNDTWRMNVAGQRTMPLQPAFLVFGGDANITGDGTVYRLGSGAPLTIQYDQSGSVGTNGIFTAPVTGIYHFTAYIELTNIGAAHTSCNYSFGIPGINVVGAFNPAAVRTGTAFGLPVSRTIPLTAGATAVITTTVSGSTKTVGANAATSYFCGFLVC